jgi:prolipoprotein diacylglyceryl transferase
MAAILAYSIDFQREAFSIPGLHMPIYWYGILFAFGFYLSTIFLKYEIKTKVLLNLEQDKKLEALIQSLAAYMIVAIVVGARVFHVAFYDGFSYLYNVDHLLNIRDGGLASHGAILCMIFSFLIFFKVKEKELKELKISNRLLFDVTCHASLINSFFIRIGNFINQEIVGLPTDSIFGITFMHPSGGLEVLKRHPAQLYEAIFYLGFFFLMFFLFKKIKAFLIPGVFTGLFFAILFMGRVFIEMFKEKQSVYDGGGVLMGEILSLPFIIGGCLYAWIYYKKSKRNANQELNQF